MSQWWIERGRERSRWCSRSARAPGARGRAGAASRAPHDAELYGIARDAYVYAYPARHDGRDDAADDERGGGAERSDPRAGQPVRARPQLPRRGRPHASSASTSTRSTRSAWVDVVARAGRALGARHGRPLLPLPAPRHVDRRLRGAGHAHDAGTARGAFAIVGPGFTGALPAGITRIDAPTSKVWIVGRTQTNGPADFENVHRRSRTAYALTPLSPVGEGVRAAGRRRRTPRSTARPSREAGERARRRRRC